MKRKWTVMHPPLENASLESEDTAETVVMKMFVAVCVCVCVLVSRWVCQTTLTGNIFSSLLAPPVAGVAWHGCGCVAQGLPKKKRLISARRIRKERESLLQEQRDIADVRT